MGNYKFIFYFVNIKLILAILKTPFLSKIINITHKMYSTVWYVLDG